MCWSKCCLRCWSRCWLTVWWNFRRAAFNADDASNAQASFRVCQKVAPDFETVRCIGGFSILSEDCIWLWNSQMHWRVFDIVRKLHLTLKQSDALTDFLIYFAVSITGVVARFWLYDADRSAGRQAGRTADKQAGRTKRQMRRCLLTAKADKLIREKWWKQWFSRDVFKKRAESKLSTNSWSWRF